MDILTILLCYSMKEQYEHLHLSADPVIWWLPKNMRKVSFLPSPLGFKFELASCLALRSEFVLYI